MFWQRIRDGLPCTDDAAGAADGVRGKHDGDTAAAQHEAGSKEALVVSYLQHRDARWREYLAARLERSPAMGVDRVLVVFDAAISWSDENSPRGCSAINARAEIGDGDEGLIFPEVIRQKAWLLDLFTALCLDAGDERPEDVARSMMLLYEGAIVTVGMSTFDRPFQRARELAREILVRRTP